MAERSADWFRQAESDLRHARHALDDGDYDWAAFASHQAAEKAIKAVFRKLHMEAQGNMVSKLLVGLPRPVSPDGALIDRAKTLDRHYLQSRYPNLLPGGAPVDFYTLSDADRAIAHAEALLQFCRDQVSR